MRNARKPGTDSKLPALFGAIAIAAVIAGGCATELPTEPQAMYSNDD